jgi:hypothetical protein
MDAERQEQFLVGLGLAAIGVAGLTAKFFGWF